MGRTEIVVDLSWGSAVQLVGGLNFYHESFVDDHVESLSNDLLTFVVDWNEHLSPHVMAPGAQLSFERSYIYLFKKPKTKSIVYVIKSTNNGVR